MANANGRGYRATTRITGVIFAGREVFEGRIDEGTRIEAIEPSDGGAWLYFDDRDDLWVEHDLDGYVCSEEEWAAEGRAA